MVETRVKPQLDDNKAIARTKARRTRLVRRMALCGPIKQPRLIERRPTAKHRGRIHKAQLESNRHRNLATGRKYTLITHTSKS
jgi:hypothetical protein